MSKRILVVEDQEDNRQILRDLLGGAGYQMTEAWDREAGVSAAKEQHPDRILIDIQLPHMDGYEATRRIKADPELKSIPVIAVTSYALSGDDDKAHAAGCDGYVTKPALSRERMGCRFCAATARTRVDRESHRRDRLSLGGGERRAVCRHGDRICPAQGRCHRHVRDFTSPRGKAGNISHPDRVRDGRGPGWEQSRREPDATGRQRYRPVEPDDRHRCQEA